MTDTPTKECAVCGELGRYVVLSSYTVTVEDQKISIPNAHVVECSSCGIRPVSTEENSRWRQIVYARIAPDGDGKDTCLRCRKPRAMCGRMMEHFVDEENVVRLCGECSEVAKWTDFRPEKLL